MNILKLLKQLKNIEPDKNYTSFSRQKIMAEIDKESFILKPKNNSIIKIFNTFSISFAALIIILGIFFIIKDFTPKFNILNPNIIKAEADAIDFQIQLSKIIYNTPTTPRILNSIINPKSKIIYKNDLSTSTSNNTTTIINKEIINKELNELTIEEVLDYISK